MNRWIKWGLVIVLLLLAGILLYGWLKNEPQPTANFDTEEADELAFKMLDAVNKPAWDSTQWIEWTFRSGTTYLWDKKRNFVRVQFEEATILLHTPTKTGTVSDKNGAPITDTDQKKEWIDKAWANFANDSFWLCAPMKAFDPGTKRSIVELENGDRGLMVKYEQGGVTPGDSYLWILDKNYKPRAWKMWVSIIPVGGMEFSWEDWQEGHNIPSIALAHHSDVLDVPIIDLSIGDQITAIKNGTDPFDGFLK